MDASNLAAWWRMGTGRWPKIPEKVKLALKRNCQSWDFQDIGIWDCKFFFPIPITFSDVSPLKVPNLSKFPCFFSIFKLMDTFQTFATSLLQGLAIAEVQVLLDVCLGFFSSKTGGFSTFPLDSKSFKDVNLFLSCSFLVEGILWTLRILFHDLQIGQVMISQVSDRDMWKVHSLCAHLVFFYCICWIMAMIIGRSISIVSTGILIIPSTTSSRKLFTCFSAKLMSMVDFNHMFRDGMDDIACEAPRSNRFYRWSGTGFTRKSSGSLLITHYLYLPLCLSPSLKQSWMVQRNRIKSLQATLWSMGRGLRSSNSFQRVSPQIEKWSDETH